MKREAIQMHPFALALCAEALGCDVVDVLAMCESADLSFALQAAQVMALRQRCTAGLDGDHADKFYQAVRAGWGERPFMARELLQWAESGHSPDSRAVLHLARAMCGTSENTGLTVQALGMQLARLAQLAGAPLLRTGEARGSAVWQLRDLRG